MPIALHKLSLVSCTISPFVFSFPVGMTLHISPLIVISIRKLLFTESMFEKIYKLTLISLSVFHDMNSIAAYLPIFPFAHVAFPFKRSPVPAAIFLTIFPLALIVLPMAPKELPLTASKVILKLSFILSEFCDFHSFDPLLIIPNSLK